MKLIQDMKHKKTNLYSSNALETIYVTLKLIQDRKHRKIICILPIQKHYGGGNVQEPHSITSIIKLSSASKGQDQMFQNMSTKQLT